MVRAVLVLVTLAACKAPAPSARDRILAVLPGDASAVFVADGAALAHAKFRPIVDVLRPRWPVKLGCVIDAGLAADEVGIATTDKGTSIALVMTKPPKKCPELSQQTSGLWVASIGEGVFAGGAVLSVATDPRFARARAHLGAAPVAAMMDSARFKTRIHASAQPTPLEAWVAFDADPAFADTLEAGVRALVERMRVDSTTSGVAARLTVKREGAQIVARVTGVVDADLAAAARTLVGWGWGQTKNEPAPLGWTCPQAGDLVLGCTDRTTLEVTSLTKVAEAIKAAPLATVVTNGQVSGLRLDGDLPSFGLVRGDLVFACEGRPLENRDQLIDAILHGPHEASIVVRRDAVDTKLVFDEQR